MLMEHTLSTQEKMKYIGRGAARQNRLSFQSFQSSHTDLDCTSLITFSLKSNIKFKQYWKKMTPKKKYSYHFSCTQCRVFFWMCRTGLSLVTDPSSFLKILQKISYRLFHISLIFIILFANIRIISPVINRKKF